MPLEDLDEYGSDSGSSIQSRNSDAVPKTPEYDSDSNATEAESNGEPSEEQISDGNQMIWTSTRPNKNPSSTAVRRLTRMTMMVSGVTSAASSCFAFNGSLLPRGTRIMLRKKIMNERLPELWQNLFMMRGWKSLRDTMPRRFTIFVSKR